MTRTTTHTTKGLIASAATIAGLMLTSAAARAGTCTPVYVDSAVTVREIAGRDASPACFAIPKSEGTAVIITARSVTAAGKDDVHVIASASNDDPAFTREEDSIPLPQALGGARIIPTLEDGSVLYLYIEPQHARGYKLAIMMHQVDVNEVLKDCARNIGINLVLEAVVGTTVKDAVPFLSHPLVGYAFKAAKTYARSDSEAQFIEELAIGLALDGSMRAADVPPFMRILVNAFVMTAVREMSRGAVIAYTWSGTHALTPVSAPEAELARQ